MRAAVVVALLGLVAGARDWARRGRGFEAQGIGYFPGERAARQCTGVYQQSPNCFNDYSANPIDACGNFRETLAALPVEERTLFLQIGDFGIQGACESQVASFLHRLEGSFESEVDFIWSLGDNNYWNGACDTMDKNVGGYYSKWIPKPPTCLGLNRKWLQSPTPKFWPTVGNHDWQGSKNVSTLPYVEYFPYLVTNTTSSRHHGVTWSRSFKNMDVYALNSNWDTPQKQGEMMEWLDGEMGKNKANPFQIVFAHHPAYSTAHADQPLTWLRRNYSSLLASPSTQHTLFFSGHEHVYERIEFERETYIINGLGGHPWRYHIHENEGCTLTPGSQVRFNGMHGVGAGLVTNNTMEYCFWANNGTLIDHRTWKV